MDFPTELGVKPPAIELVWWEYSRSISGSPSITIATVGIIRSHNDWAAESSVQISAEYQRGNNKQTYYREITATDKMPNHIRIHSTRK